MSTALAPDGAATTTEPTNPPADTAGSSSPAVDAAATEQAKPVVEYTLTLPDQAALPAEAIERTTAIARELGLSNEAAQKVLESMNQEAASLVDARVQAAIQSTRPGGDEWNRQAAEWERQTMEDPSLGKTPEDRKAAIAKGVAVIDKFAQAQPKHGKALRELLNTTAMGNHPQVVHFFAWLGQSAGEPQTMVKGGDVATEKDWRQTWFPKTYAPKDDAA